MSSYSRREFFGPSALSAGGRIEFQSRSSNAPSVQTSRIAAIALSTARWSIRTLYGV